MSEEVQPKLDLLSKQAETYKELSSPRYSSSTDAKLQSRYTSEKVVNYTIYRLFKHYYSSLIHTKY